MLLQTYTENAYRGRVMSIYMTQFSVMSFGAFAIGLLVEVVGAQWALGGASALLVAVSLAYLMWSPRLRELD